MKKKLLAGLATGLLLFGMVGTASATLVNLSITGSWSASDFATGNLPDSDGNVFGLAPYDGSLTVDLLVNTDSFMHYAAGYSYDYLGTTYTLAHDWYGYSDVSLAGGSFSFGNATWDSSDILTNLIGVDRLGASLWTDADITTDQTTRLSFRMMGSYGNANGTADIFFGIRILDPPLYAINSQFFALEYYGGDEISSNSYSVTSAIVPEPATMLLFGTGLAGLAGSRLRRKKK